MKNPAQAGFESGGYFFISIRRNIDCDLRGLE